MPTRTNLLQANSATSFGAGAYTPASFTPSNNVLVGVLARAMQTDDTGLEGTTLTITDSAGLTWTSRVASATSPGWSYGHRFWTAPVTTGESMTVSIDAGAFSVEIYRVEVYQWADYDTVTPVGATADGTDADGNGAAAITLGAAPASNSEVIAFMTTVMNSGASSAAPGAGWTELFDFSSAAGFITAQTQVRSGSTSTSVDWADLSDGAGSPLGTVLSAVEIRHAASGGGATPIVGKRVFRMP
jgi:hypothetical protein